MSREIMQKTLNALRRVGEYGDIYRYKNTEQSPYTQIYEAIDALNVELAKPKQEPVAYMTYKGYLYHAGDPKVLEHSDPTPLYDEPPRKEWVSDVTDSQLIEEVRKRGFQIRDAQISPLGWVGLTEEECHRFIKYTEENFAAGVLWAETKLKERNCG